MPDIEGYKTLAGKLPPNTAVFVPKEPSKWWAALKMFKVLVLKIAAPRNYEFHKKFFALLNFAFEHWDEKHEYKGAIIQKNFDRFREEITIRSGYFDIVPSLFREPVAIAKSISWAKMDEEQFQELYKACFTVIWDRVFINLYDKPEDLEKVLYELNGFS